MKRPTTTTATPSAEELRRIAADMERAAAQLRAAASGRGDLTTARRAAGRATATARRVLQWGQGDEDKAA